MTHTGHIYTMAQTYHNDTHRSHWHTHTGHSPQWYIHRSRHTGHTHHNGTHRSQWHTASLPGPVLPPNIPGQVLSASPLLSSTGSDHVTLRQTLPLCRCLHRVSTSPSQDLPEHFTASLFRVVPTVGFVSTPDTHRSP